jgi:biopolymer transport protein TolQ
MTPLYFLAEARLSYIWGNAPIEGQIIIVALVIFSIFAWSVMVSKALQMSRAKKLNRQFDREFRSQKNVLTIYQRKVDVEGCPLFSVYKEGAREMETRLKPPGSSEPRTLLTLKSMEHIKRTLESSVAREALNLESGLILLAIAVSGAPFIGLLGTVWGVMITFADVGQRNAADLATMAPGVSAALITTVGGLLVAIPSMFAYNWLVHTLRVLTVELDNFAQELLSRIETEYLQDE